MIEIIGTELYQWDTGKSVRVTGTDASHVHLANQGDSKAVIMELVDSLALIPDYLLQTGKQLCVYAVANGVTIESRVFFVKKRERPENYVYEDDQRNFIYTLITDAQEATKTANQVAQDLLEAKERGDFNGPKGDPFLIINDASGVEIAANDAAKHTFMGMRIFGKTTQDGVPTPDAPVELVSVGDSGSITVSVTKQNESQSMTLATPNGLPGIPVTSGGNYTDANGQRWICDEVDFARGVYVQRVGAITTEDFRDLTFAVNNSNAIYTQYIAYKACKMLPADIASISYPQKAYCNRFPLGAQVSNGTAQESFWIYYDGAVLFVLDKNTSPDVASAKEYILSRDLVIYYILKTTIETPLSAEELAAYAALHTYRGNTTVSNDAGAYMEIEYVMDAKKYLDSLGSSTILAATVE